MSRLLRLLRNFCAEQKHLQQLYLDRHDFSGRDGVLATRTLRWTGSELVGDFMPGPNAHPQR